MECSTPGLCVHHQILQFNQTNVHWVGDAIQASHPLSSPSPYTFNLSQHQCLFKSVSYLHQVAKVLEFQLQHQSFQWTPRETVETMSDFIFGGSKITADGDCNHEIKRRLLLGRKVMTNLDSIFKSRDITLPAKVRLVRLWFFLWSCMDVRVGLWRRLSAEELMHLSCGVGEDSWESLGLQGEPTSPS